MRVRSASISLHVRRTRQSKCDRLQIKMQQLQNWLAFLKAILRRKLVSSQIVYTQKKTLDYFVLRVIAMAVAR